MEIARGAASSDPAIAGIYEQRPRARLTNEKAIAKRLAELRALPALTSAETAADLLWLYTAPETYRMLVIERKWSPNRYRTWFRAAVGTIIA
ncbi:MAG: hypothetical protein JO304_22770 [Solirubrobacterales bacterium]|nr:hypothetical protein [Solirubrobacterales bacterium]